MYAPGCSASILLGESASHGDRPRWVRILQRGPERIDAMDEANDAEGARYDPRKDADNSQG